MMPFEDVAQGIRREGRYWVHLRTLLGWFGHRKRGKHIINEVRAALGASGLTANPDISHATLDQMIELRSSSAQDDECQAVHEDEFEIVHEDELEAVPSTRTWPVISPIGEEDAGYRASEEWELVAAERLRALLTYDQLEKMLGNLAYTVRQSRRQRDGRDRRGTALELAGALLVRHGRDLFAEGTIREAVATACSVDFPKAWHPGKHAAIQFVQQTNMPRELEGLPGSERREDFEEIAGHPKLGALSDFQMEIARKLWLVVQDRSRALATLPTGAGKTRVAVEVITEWLEKESCRAPHKPHPAVVWLAHTEELCEQAYSCFSQIWAYVPRSSPLLVVRLWSGYTTSQSKVAELQARFGAVPVVVVSTPQRLLSVAEKPLGPIVRQSHVLVVDEAHRAAAPSYGQVIQWLEQRDWGSVSVVGLTATPFRREYNYDDPEIGTRELADVFNGDLIEPSETLGEEPRRVLQDRGYLAKLVFEEIETGVTLRMPTAQSQDWASRVRNVDQELGTQAGSSTSRRLVIQQRIYEVSQEQDPESSTLYFGPTVEDAECMAYLLRERGVQAAALSGNTRPATRRRIVELFRRRELRVLCNCHVLTTGFDAPSITHVVIARPTISQVLYEQMVGRGLRGAAFGGTEVCKIMDCRDYVRDEFPQLGYKRFRHLWNFEVQQHGAAHR